MNIDEEGGAISDEEFMDPQEAVGCEETTTEKQMREISKELARAQQDNQKILEQCQEATNKALQDQQAQIAEREQEHTRTLKEAAALAAEAESAKE
jgi:hypothetical protein